MHSRSSRSSGTIRGREFPALPIAKRGFLGVDLFFVISGFLIVTLLLRERRQTGAISLRRFYARRFLRIFPAYYAMLALVAATAFVRHQGAPNPIRDDLPFAIFYISNLVPMHSLLSITWSLSAEEQFYCIVPSLEKYAGRAFTLLLALAYVVVTLPAFWLWAALPLPDFFRQTTFGPILLGVLLAHTLDAPAGDARMVRVFGQWWAPWQPWSWCWSPPATPRPTSRAGRVSQSSGHWPRWSRRVSSRNGTRSRRRCGSRHCAGLAS